MAHLRQTRMRRLSSQSRKEAERKLQVSGMHDWLSRHSLVAVPRVEISKTRKAALRALLPAPTPDEAAPP